MDHTLSIDAAKANLRAASSARRIAGAQHTPSGTADAEALTWFWIRPYLRAIALFTIVLQTTLLVLDWSAASSDLVVLCTHLLALAVPATYAAIINTRWFERHWPAVSLASGLLLLAASVKWSLIAGTADDYVFAASILLLVAAAVLPWRTRWQALLTVGAMVALAAEQLYGTRQPHLFRQWLELMAAAVLANSVAMLFERFRGELSQLLATIQRDSTKAEEVAAREALVEARERAEQQSRERDELLRMVFDTAPEVITLNELEHGAFIEIGNSNFFGYSRNEVIDSSALQIGLWVNPEDRAEYVRRLRADGIVHNMEVELRNKDGTTIPTLISGSLIHMHGKEYMLTFPREISELKRVQADLETAREQLSAQVTALRESQARLRAEILEREATQGRLAENEAVLAKVYNAALETIALTRLSDGVLLDVNEEFSRTFGYPHEEAVGRNVLDLGLWPRPEQLRALQRLLREDSFARNFEADGRAKDGRVVPMIMSAAIVEIRGEQCVVSMAHDITEAKEAERQLISAREAALSASRAKSEFLSSMSHEIRTPMNAILGMAELLAEMPMDEEQRHYLETMQNNGNALLELINGILDLAKVESGRLNLEIAEFALSDVVDKVLETLGPRAYAKQLEVIGHIFPQVPLRLIGDAMRLRQILINLIGNAIKFTEHGSVVLAIDVATTDPPSRDDEVRSPKELSRTAAARSIELIFTVSDTGIGIAPDKLDELFSPFMQADTSTARKYGGSGLGLAIVKRLVELMGGAVSVESELGRGSSFRFSTRFSVAAQLESQPPAIIAQTYAGRALIGDANAENRAILRETLEARGASVIEVADGPQLREALAVAAHAAQSYDLAILDCRMNDVDAFVTAQELLAPDRERDRAREVVLMLAPDELNRQLALMRELGLGTPQRCHYLVKPLKTADISEIFKHLNAPPPIVGNGAPHSVALDRTAGADHETPALRILVADDSPDNRMLVQAYLKQQPYQLDFAENGQVAIDSVKTKPYDLVLMDIQMPVVDGYEAVRAIRQWESEQHLRPTRIIALTASAIGDAARRSLEVGCDAHLTKPVKKRTLLETVREIAGAPNGQPAPAREIAVDSQKKESELAL